MDKKLQFTTQNDRIWGDISIWDLHLETGEAGHSAVYSSWPAQGHCLDAAIGADQSEASIITSIGPIRAQYLPGMEEAGPGRGWGHRHGRRLRLGRRAAELQPEVPLEPRVINIACSTQYIVHSGTVQYNSTGCLKKRPLIVVLVF